MGHPSRGIVRGIGLVAGPVLALVAWALLPGGATGLDPSARATAALAVWMASWWLTEALPIAATALLPLVVLPLAGRPMDEAASPYAHPLIFLFLGGFLVALAMERWQLHRRIALVTLGLVGTKPRNVVGGFMAVTALLSMWISNTATTIMMLPIALSVIDLVGRQRSGESPMESGVLPEESRGFALCMLLGVAYAASIGGLGTLIGTPPNLFLASYVQESLGREIAFAHWLAVGLPLVAVMLPLCWYLLTRWLYPIRIDTIAGEGELLQDELRSLGPLSRGEKITLAVFVAMALTWVFRPLLAKLEIAGGRPLSGLTDTGVAIAAALLLFAIPVEPRKGVFALDWASAKRVPWGILLLFGGGLSLAAALDDTGVTSFLGERAQVLEGTPTWLAVAFVTALVVFLTEVTSNTATTTAFVPILAGLAPALGVDPYVLIVPATIAASCAFMMPVATPPNAVVFGSGWVTIPQMARAGLWLNLVTIGVVVLYSWLVALPVLGVR